MSMKQELETWVAALQLYDKQDLSESISAFQPIADTSKILFNCGVIHATLGQHQEAVHYYERATALDMFLAIAYFQRGVSNFIMGEFEDALANFNDTLLYLRGNKFIDYEQLGLKFKLHACEALFNRGLCFVYLMQTENGMKDLEFAAKEKIEAHHDVIDEAIRDKGEGYTVFSISPGLLFRPNEAKVKNVRARDYLGQSRLVASRDPQATEHHRRQSVEQWARDDRPADKLSYAATNLVKPNLQSRTRQQSAPPLHRNVFPPTPPPEIERPGERLSQPSAAAAPAPTPPPKADATPARGSSPDRRPSSRSQSLAREKVPAPLDLGIAAFDRNKPSTVSKVSTTTTEAARHPQRSESARPATRRAATDVATLDAMQQQRHSSQAGAMDYDGPRSQAYAQLSNRPPPRGESSPAQPPRTKYPMPRDSAASDISSVTMPSKKPFSRQPHDSLTDTESVFSRGSFAPSSVGTIMEVSEDPLSPRRAQPLHKIRVKVHHGDDTRYVIVLPDVRFAAFAEQLERKFALAPGTARIKTKDEEGDLITIGDQEDLDMVVAGCRFDAAREGIVDIGKLEIWVQS